MEKSNKRTLKRLLIVFMLLSILIFALAFRTGWVQIVNGEEYKSLAKGQQTRDDLVAANRGTILDRNGEELAISAKAFSLWILPGKIYEGRDEIEKEIKARKIMEELSPMVGIPVDQLMEFAQRKASRVKIVKYLDKERVDEIKELKLPGMEFYEESKRYYPLGSFASHLLGSVTDDNQGLSGIELKYNQYLSGIPGRWIKSSDARGNSLAFGLEKYFDPEEGLNVVLTIDSVIQHYVERSLEEVLEETQADRVWCIMMDPKTGEVLALAVLPEFNPNDPRDPGNQEGRDYLDSLSDEEKLDYWNQMWRNPLISDTYEPGSTFKLITTAMGLEERVTYLDDVFTCTGTIKVYDTILRCWRYYQPHGRQTLVEAVGNSCNPVLVQVGQRIGEDRYYKYLDLFGFSERTNIDYPGEGISILQSRAHKNPVGLATMAYGQGIAVTPIQILSAFSAFGNEGKLMEPHLVKSLVDNEGKEVKTIEAKLVRQVISKQTAEEMCYIMESVVSEGGGGTAKVDGYRVGGKTGTAQKAKDGGYSDETYSSFIGMAPMDDPQLAILLVVDNPKGVKFGSVTAGPGAQRILAESLRYMNIKPEFTNEELAAIKRGSVVMPSLLGQSLENAMGILGGLSLEGEISPLAGISEEMMVVDQYPKAGEYVKKGSKAYLYWK